MSDIIYQGGTARIITDTLGLNSKTGEVLVVTTSTGYAMAGARIPYSAYSISRALSISDSNKVITNDGAGTFVAYTLPITSEPGINFKFVRVASFDVRITPPVGSKIRYSGGNMADAEYLALSADGAKLHLVSDGLGDWIATYEFGTLIEQTP